MRALLQEKRIDDDCKYRDCRHDDGDEFTRVLGRCCCKPAGCRKSVGTPAIGASTHFSSSSLLWSMEIPLHRR